MEAGVLVVDGGSWRCPKCGPLGGRDRPLHGGDEKFHCPNDDCDAVVEPILPRDRALPGKRASYRPPGIGPGEEDEDPPGKFAAPQTPPPAGASEGREDSVTDEKTTTAAPRLGKCGICGIQKWLIRRDPPTCTKCYHSPREAKAVVDSVTPSTSVSPVPAPARRTRGDPLPCQVYGCDRKSWSHGFCTMHSGRADRRVRAGETTWEKLEADPKYATSLLAEKKSTGKFRTSPVTGGPVRKLRPRGSEPPRCHVPRCGKFGTQRGFCASHYGRAYRRVDAGETTWEKLAVPAHALSALGERPGRNGAKKPVSVPTPAKARRPQAVVSLEISGSATDELLAETVAIEACSRSLDALPADSLERVVQYVLIRLAQRRDLKVASLLPALPGPR